MEVEILSLHPPKAAERCFEAWKYWEVICEPLSCGNRFLCLCNIDRDACKFSSIEARSMFVVGTNVHFFRHNFLNLQVSSLMNSQE